METFIFNLNKYQKYKKLKAGYSILCNSIWGLWTFEFGCRFLNGLLSSITHSANKINEYYDKGSEILPSNNLKKEYNLIEIEIYKIIIE